MGRNNASKSKKKDKTKVKLSDEKPQDSDSETKKITSHLPKKGDGDAASLKEEQKQKLSRTKKSQKNKATCSDSVNETEASKTYSKENVPSPKKNTRKRESPRFLPSPLAKIVPIFGKKRHAVQASLSQEDERQESPANTSDSQTGAEGGIESISLVVTVKEKGEIVSKICSRSDEELRESQRLVTDTKVDFHIVSHETSGESEKDVSKGSADEPKSVPFIDEIQSISDALIDENKDHDNEEDHDKESEIDDYVIQDEANFERDAEEENVKDPLKVINKEEVIVAVCQAASEEIRVVGQSGSNEDYREHNAYDDSQESDGRGMLRDVAEDGYPVKAKKAGTEHGPIISDDVKCSSIDEIKIHSDSVNIDGNQDVDKEQKWINSPGNTVFVDICTVTGANVPVCIDNEVSKYSPVKDPKCEVNDSVKGQQVSSDRKDGEHVNIEGKEDVHDHMPEGKDISRAKPDIRAMSDGNSRSCSGITSNPQHNSTHSEMPQELRTRADVMEVGVERVGNVNIVEISGEGTGDLLMYNPNSNLQCTSTEDMNAPRWDSTPVSSNNHQSCNDRLPQANGNIDGEIDGCSDPLCGSTQLFEVPLETHPSSSQGDNVMKICGSDDEEKPKESDNFSGLQGKGDKKGKLNEDYGTDDRTTIPSFNLDVPQLSCKKITVGQNFLEQDPLDDDMIDLTDSQMIELDQQCSMVNPLTKPLTGCAATPKMGTEKLQSKVEDKVYVSVGVQTLNTCTEKSESTTVVQSMIRDLRQLNATVLDLKRQMDGFRRQRSQCSSSSSYSQQHWNEYGRTRGKPFYQQ
ncbi:uncharacterized protein LOC129277534 [Lytechinus pictus]|uniref:uncharacterized protein LOC129277534 n=1 Tax=Lytechinus pictus TaxID=7653 RepID=UPI0030B9B25A